MSSLFAPAAIGMPGPLEMMILAVIALLIFGPKRLPELARSIGESVTSFKDGISGKGDKRGEEDPAKLPPAANANLDQAPTQDAAKKVSETEAKAATSEG